MHFSQLVVSAVALYASSIDCMYGKPVSKIITTAGAKVIPGRYIVALKQQVGAMELHENELNALMNEYPTAYIDRRYKSDGLTGYAGTFEKELIDKLSNSPHVDYIEQDQVVHTLDEEFHYKIMIELLDKNGKVIKNKETEITFDDVKTSALSENLITQTNVPSWGISRVSYTNLPKSLVNYTYIESAGSNVDVYVIDTGISTDHIDFEGRAKFGANFIDNEEAEDFNGHGTHCAGTIGGKTYGIAKKVNLIAVKVLSGQGSGTMSGVIAGIEYVADQHTEGARSVASMSLGGGKSKALESAVDAAIQKGIHFAVAAGNENRDACKYSPAGSELAITVGATDKDDSKAPFSNHGSCVDIHAPGLAIKSSWIGSPDASNTISGTSMACPHVAGVLALHLGVKDYTPSELKELIKKNAVGGKIRGLPRKTVNKLVTTTDLLQ